MSFNTYGGPSPWESTNNKKNPFDTQETGTTQDTSSFDTQESGVVQDTSMFNTKGNKFGQVQDTSVFDTQKNTKKDKKFIYFNPEGLISTRKHQAKVNKIIKKHLIKKFKLTKKRDKEILNLVVDIEAGGKSKKDLVPKKTKKIEKDYELVDPQIGSLDNSQSLIKQEKKYKKQSHEDLIIDLKKDLKQKEQILQRDKEHNLHIRILRQQGKIKKQILGILNQENKPRFIKYERKYETFGKTRKVADTAIALVKKKDNLGAIHCTDWVNKIYQKVAGERVYDSHTLFNGVKHISKGTGIGAAKYAPRSVISSIKPGEHIMVDLPVNGKYNNGKTHSVIALSKPNDGLIEVASYPKYGSNPVIEMYDLYGLNRAKSAKPIRIQTV